MDTAKFLEILRITLPVFALLALGNVLSRVGKMNEQHQAFLNWLVYYISLPALIFAGMAVQPIQSLLNLDFIAVTILAMAVVLLLYAGLAVVMRLDKRIAVIMVFSTYWSNVAYMGFPLAESAFGARGFLFAAIVNAVSMPAFAALTFVMIGLTSEKKQSVGRSLRDGFLNPIIIASIAGLAYSLAAGALRVGEPGGLVLPGPVGELLGIGESVMKNVGTMGLSLALIAIGGRLRFHSFGKKALPMSLAVCGKLVVLPLITLFMMRILFPSAARDVTGSAVLLMTMPTAVTAAVVAAKFKLDQDFVSSILVMSMLCSVIMIPVWLYVVL
jgi:predicted permease